MNQTQKEIAAGSVGGVSQVLVGQPFDTIKVRFQTQNSTNPQYKSVLDCFQKTLRNEGISGFYRGTLTPLLGVTACVSIQFASLDAAKRYYKSSSDFTFGQLFVSGGFAGFANSFICGPMEHVRIKLQIQTPENRIYSGPMDLISKVTKAHGPLAIYKGQMITIAREVPGFGMYFGVYEYLMQKKMKEHNISRKQISTLKQIQYGSLAGYVLWLSVYPLDIIKSKIQSDGFDASNRKYKSSLDCAAKTFKQYGIAGFYKGFSACMLRAGPANAATFVAYEMFIGFLNN